MALRGHELPTREDVYDGVRSVFIKGSRDIEGVAVIAATRRVFTGDQPRRSPGPRRHPADRRGLRAPRQSPAPRPRQGAEERELVLDGYRKAGHRRSSRFLHRLRLLDVPFAERMRGPDFVRGEDLDRIQEVWRYRWQPATESALIEASRYGASLREAAVAACMQRFAAVEAEDGRAGQAAELLLQAAVCGLHEHLDRAHGAGARARAAGSGLRLDHGGVLAPAHGALRVRAARAARGSGHRSAGARHVGARGLPGCRRLAAYPDDREARGPGSTVRLRRVGHHRRARAARRRLGPTHRQRARPAEPPGVRRCRRGTPARRRRVGGRRPRAARVRPPPRRERGPGRWSALRARAAAHGPGQPVARRRDPRGAPRVADAAVRRPSSSPWCRTCDSRSPTSLPAETDRVARQVAGLLGDTRWRPVQTQALGAEDALRATRIDGAVRQALRDDGLQEWLP